MSRLALLQCSDLHFGRDAELAQVAALEGLATDLAPTAVVVAGDLTQRARHGEFQRALEFVHALRRIAPTLVVPGNHDVEWWITPFDVAGAAAKYQKYRRYFGRELAPTIQVDGAILCGVLTSFGVVAGSMTYNLNDMAVKGHLPASETERAGLRFAEESADLLRVLVMHQNLLRGGISRRMGLARWRAAWRQVMATGADLVLCGHDHQEGAGLLPNGAVVATSGTHTSRTRGKRPSACNFILVDDREITVRHYIWQPNEGRFLPGEEHRFPRPRAAAASATSDG